MRPHLAAATALAGLAILASSAAAAVGATETTSMTGTTGTTGAPAPAPAPAPAGPFAAGPVLATLDADVPIAAGGGWVVWSVPVTGGFGLVGSHGGVTQALDVAPRPEPFDASVGTSATGSPVVTFSRCTKTPGPVAAGLGVMNPLSGRGCRIHVLDLATDRESTPPIPHPTGTSDTTGSMSHGRVAFARLDPAHHQEVQQILVWTPGHRTLKTLPHGAMPGKCPSKEDCAGLARSGVVQGLAYDARLVSFLWEPSGYDIGDAAWEVRADNAATGHSALVSSGDAGEVCGGPGPDLVAPSPPVLDGDTVSLVSLEGDCYVFNSVFGQISTATGGNGSYADIPGVVLGLAEDGSRIYALEASAPAEEVNPTCTTSDPCEIQQIPHPGPLKREPRKPSSPFL